MYDSESAYKVTQEDAEELALTMDYDNCLLNASSKAGESVIFDKKGYVSVTGESADYSIGMTFDEDYPTDWFAIEINGENANDVSLEKAENGWIMESDNFQNVEVKTNNKENSTNVSFSTKYPAVYIYEINENTIGVSVDSDNNGTYETQVETAEIEPIPSPKASLTPTDNPSNPTDRPNTPTDNPIIPTDKPSNPTDKPSIPTDKPIIPTDYPLTPTDIPSASTDNPTTQTAVSTSNSDAQTTATLGTTATPSLTGTATQAEYVQVTAAPAPIIIKINKAVLKKGKKVITGTVSVKGATVKIKVGSKAYKKATVKGKAFTLKLTYRLKKKTKVIIKVTKKECVGVNKTYKVK